MSLQIHSLLPATPIPEGIHQLLAGQYSEMPIVNKSGEYCGMFSEKCCMKILSNLADLIEDNQHTSFRAADVMIPRHKLFMLNPEDDVISAISALLEKKYTGAPVVDSQGRCLGVFSERTCLGYVIEAIYSRVPSAQVQEFTDSDSNRLIDLETGLHQIFSIFDETFYGRLPVIQNNEIAGQVTRRDVLKHSTILSNIMQSRLNAPHVDAGIPEARTAAYSKAHDTFLNHPVSVFTEENSYTIDPEMSLLSVAQLFFDSPHRRFPVVEAGNLIGLVDRCDVLRFAIKLFK
ncbi:CBS domain-containing protein [Gimesia sp.]|uniref:CBS domain-containing protein n=1 Tax=Gimesia sp. TaxID=2024833 RepID=UPI0032EFE468